MIGVHVTPTVFFNVSDPCVVSNGQVDFEQGIEEKSISSSFTSDQWKEWLQKNVV